MELYSIIIKNNFKRGNAMREKTVCFSGHRPAKLPFKGDTNAPETKILISMIYKEIQNSIDEGYDTFITGVAKGVDLWAGSLVADIKSTSPEIKLISAVPYKSYGVKWKGTDKWNLSYVMQKSDKIYYVCDEYSKICMKKRNEYMVDNSSKLIAVINDYKSGTGQTIRYAKKNNLKIKIIKPIFNV